MPCPDCKCTSPPLHGDGPGYDIGRAPCRILFVGDRPSEADNKYGVLGRGQASHEFTDTYLARARLNVRDVFFENTMLCYDPNPHPPTARRARACASWHLRGKIHNISPDVIVLMGRTACSIADFPIRLDMHHGRPHFGSVLDGAWSGPIWTSFHPSLGMRDTPKMWHLLDDFVNFGAWLRGTWAPPTMPDSGNARDYELVASVPDLVEYLRASSPWDFCPADTERHGPRPYSLQFSRRPGSGRMILAERPDLLREFASWQHTTRTPVYFHFAGQDLDITDALGCSPDARDVYDSMTDAYHACTLPQGLKPLAYRLLGATMRSWEDVVRPASIRAVISWLEDAHALASETLCDSELIPIARGKCEACGHGAHDGHVCKSRASDVPLNAAGKRVACGCESAVPAIWHRVESRPSACEKILRHVLTYTAKSTSDELLGDDGAKPYDPWRKLPEMQVEGLRGDIAPAEHWDYLLETLGPMPILGIGNCDLVTEAMPYGASDADHLGQVVVAMREIEHSNPWQVDERDWDEQ